MFLVGILKHLRELEWIPILFVRLSVGVLFFESGRSKLFFKLEELGEYFVRLGIPFPHLNAFITASIEFFMRRGASMPLKKCRPWQSNSSLWTSEAPTNSRVPLARRPSHGGTVLSYPMAVKKKLVLCPRIFTGLFRLE